METEEKKRKINFHLTTNEDGLYFWDRIQFKTIQKWIFILVIAMAVLPIFTSLTVKPWITFLKGPEAAKNMFYMIMGEYWSSLIYYLGAAVLFFALLGAASRYKGCCPSCLGEKKWYLDHWLCVNMLLLLIWSVISFCFAKDKKSGLWGDYYCHEGLILYFFYAVFFLAGSWLSLKNMKAVAETLVAVCAFTGILVITNNKVIPGLFYMENNQEVMFHQYNHYGYFLSICTPLAMGLMLQDENPGWVKRIFRLAELWLIFNAVAVNSVRGSFLAIAAVLICWNMYILILKRDLWKRLLAMDLLFIGTLAFLNTGSVLFSRMGELTDNLEAVTQADNKQAAIDHVGSGRGQIWRFGMQFAVEKPIFGYGPANLMEPYAAVECHTSSPHSDMVLMAASLGFPALTFYLSGLVGHLVGFFKTVKKMSVLEVTMYASVAGYLIGSLTGVSIYYTAPYYFLILGFSYGIYRAHRNPAPAAVGEEHSDSPEPEEETEDSQETASEV